MIFDKIVQPILLYGCEVLGFSNFAAIERLSNIWLEQTTHNTKWLKAKIKLTLTDQFKQNWQFTVQSSPKALNYRIYIDELK